MKQLFEKSTNERPMVVLGAGTLGRRIALMLCTQGAEVRIYDKSTNAINEAKEFIEQNVQELLKTIPSGRKGVITTSTNLQESLENVWLAIESLPEIPELKIEVLGQVDNILPPDVIMATNSSSYRSSQLSGNVKHKNRLLSMHFMMPPMARAVELMTCGETDQAILEFLAVKLKEYGLSPYLVERESTGFIYNRIWAAIKRESLYVVAQGVASPETVDNIYKETMGTPYGPFRLMDQVGLDVVLDIEEHYAKEREGIPEEPRELLRKMVAQGKLGRKSGEGFYNDYKK